LMAGGGAGLGRRVRGVGGGGGHVVAGAGGIFNGRVDAAVRVLTGRHVAR